MSIVEVNRALEDAPELINQDPYGKGWLAGVELTDFALQDIIQRILNYIHGRFYHETCCPSIH
jgi:glycine cleavage system H protein